MTIPPASFADDDAEPAAGAPAPSPARQEAAFSPANLALLEAKLRDPLWRLTSGELYHIRTADGQGIIPFQPRPEQVTVLKALLAATDERGPRQIAILKSRRLGMSTTLGVFCADCVAFRKGWQGSLIDQTKSDASLKLNGIVKVALDHLPPWLAAKVSFAKCNDGQVTLDVLGSGESSFYAGMNARGGSNRLLWISEWGGIQAEDPGRSTEIRTGALPSARHGCSIIETTWKGGKGGDVWELIRPSLEGKADDWQVVFFPWYIDPRNAAPEAALDAEAEAYFQEAEPRLATVGVVLTDSQRRWWARERRAQGIFMKRENPTFLEECWTAPIEGAIYAAFIERARAEGRICPMPVAGDALVHTSWDLGSPLNTAVWYWQVVGREIRMIDCDLAFEGTLTERVAMMLRKGYAFGRHYLPHDARQTERSGGNFADALRNLGLTNTTCVPRSASVWIGINHAAGLFPSLVFRSPACDTGLDTLSAYRQRSSTAGGLATNEPVHDWASHCADAFRTMAEAHRAGLFKFACAAHSPDRAPPGTPSRKGMKARRVSA